MKSIKNKKKWFIMLSFIICFVFIIVNYYNYKEKTKRLLFTCNIEDVDNLNYIYEEKSIFNFYRKGYQLYYKNKQSDKWKYLASFKEQIPILKEVYRNKEYVVYQEENTERVFIDYNNRDKVIDLTQEIVYSLKKGDMYVYENDDIGDAVEFFMEFKPKDTSTYYGKRIEIIRIYYNFED